MSNSWKIPTDWQKRPVCVLGGGVLGRRIAACFVAAGHHVRIRDPSEDARNGAIEYLKNNLGSFTALTRHKSGTYKAVASLSEGVKDCWLVFEAVPEVLKIKEETFKDLEQYAPQDCILASNSSSYKSGELLGKVKDATRVRILNTHFMMPPTAMVVELMTSGYTSDTIFPFLEERFREAGLHPVTALKESTGFIFNRIWAAIKREVLAVLAEGVATPETIDDVWRQQYSNNKLGPCQMMDAVGLDTVEHIEQHYVKERQLPTTQLDFLRDNYTSKGKLGLKSGQAGGLYDPPKEGSRTKILLLNVGLNEPLKDKSVQQVMTSGQILSFTPELPGIGPAEIIGNLPLPDGIDVSHSTKKMYWTNMGNPAENDGSIQFANLDGSDSKYLVKPGVVHTPKQLTIANDQIYVSDREGLRVHRFNLDGSNHQVLFQSGDWEKEPEKSKDGRYWPVGIAVSKKLNKFFWTQKGQSKANEGRIFSAGLELPERCTASTRSDIELVIDGLPECIDLELDDDAGVLYWTDRGELPLGNTLNKKHIAGSIPQEEKVLGRQIIAQGLGEGIGLRLDREHNCLYVADMTGHLWKCSTDYGLKEKLLEGATHAYTGLCFYKY